MKHSRPDVFSYHDFRKFLADYLKYLKEKTPGFNSVKLASDAQISKSYFSMMMKGERKLTPTTLAKILPHLHLTDGEQSYLRSLVNLANSPTQIEKTNSIELMQKLRSYKKNNPQEAIIYRYLSRWYHVAIRELAALPDFKMDAKWIQKRLKGAVLLSDIEKSLEFLKKHGFLSQNEQGKISPPKHRIECLDEVFKTAMLKFHEQVFNFAIAEVPKMDHSRKFLNAHTTALSKESFKEIKNLLNETIAKIVEISARDQKPETVFQFTLLGMAVSEDE